jgi:proteasome lid subunit RPN8/RPN11
MNPLYRTMLTSHFSELVLHDASVHARLCYPQESCGYVKDGMYVPCKNAHAKPRDFFTIDDRAFDQAILDGTVEAIVHSHPDGELFPSQADMESQMANNVPFILIQLNDSVIGEIVAWGDTLPIPPVLSRPFCHGILDCYSLIRDAMRLGKEGLAKENIDWPHDPVTLPQVARDDCWWKDGKKDLYSDYLQRTGFRQISLSEVRPGDGFLMALGDRTVNPNKVLNHAGLLTGGDLILHHLPLRLSGRTPLGMWVRYEGPGSEA